MARFPVDAPRDRVLESENDDGSKTPMTLPNHRFIKGSTLRTVLTQSGVSREEFLTAYDAS